MLIWHPSHYRVRGRPSGQSRKARQRTGIAADPLSRLLGRSLFIAAISEPADMICLEIAKLLAVCRTAFHERDGPLDGRVYTQIARIEQVGIVRLA